MESLSRISSLLETARDLTLEAAQAASVTGRVVGARNAPPKQSSSHETRRLLNSRMDREVLDGLRKVIAMMSRGTDCSEFFADVVKNVASPTLEIKKLVYIYLLRYAESEPDLALLSINTIQKALNDQNQLVRAMAIRVMSGIRVPVISQIVALGIKKCVTDMSAYVRKSGAMAIPKCYKLDPTTLPQLTEYLGTLLGDRSFYVVGAAVMAHLEVCPDRWDLVHPHYRSLVKMLIDMDEWGQLATLRLLTMYARMSFPIKKVKQKKSTGKTAEEGFYSDEEEEAPDDDGKETTWKLDPDLELLLKAGLPLLQSRNSAVIVAVARVYRHLAPPDHLSTVAGPLVSLLRAPLDVQHLALINIVSIALTHAHPFSPFTTHFLVNASDPPYIWRLKIEVLTLIFPHATSHNKNLILSELEYFAQGYDKELIKESVRAIGRCAQNQTKNAARCLRVLLRQIDSSDGTLVAESLTVIRHIIQQDPAAHAKTVVRLAKALDTTTNASARASIVWLVGEFAGIEGGNNVAADTLRILAKGFPDEAELTKQQIVLLAAKVYANHLNRTQPGIKPPPPPNGAEGEGRGEEEQEEDDQHPISLLFSYVLLLARYDVSYDLRDRARLYKSLLAVPSSTQLASLLLLAPKPTPQAPSPSAGREDFVLGSANMVLGRGESLSGYEPLPDWVSASRAPSPSLREPPAGSTASPAMKAVGSMGGMGIVAGDSKGMRAGSPRLGGPETLRPTEGRSTPSNVPVESLEDFLASDGEEEEEEESGEEEESEGEEETDEESEEESDEEEESGEETDAEENAKLLP